MLLAANSSETVETEIISTVGQHVVAVQQIFTECVFHISRI